MGPYVVFDLPNQRLAVSRGREGSSVCLPACPPSRREEPCPTRAEQSSPAFGVETETPAPALGSAAAVHVDVCKLGDVGVSCLDCFSFRGEPRTPPRVGMHGR